MGTFRKLAVHRPWEDWLLLALGLLICFSPSLAESGYSGAPAASALIAGFIIIFVAQLEIVALSRWEEIINLICGAWIVVAPLILGYSGNLRLWHFGLGGLVVIITLFEFWQDNKMAMPPPEIRYSRLAGSTAMNCLLRSSASLSSARNLYQTSSHPSQP